MDVGEDGVDEDGDEDGGEDGDKDGGKDRTHTNPWSGHFRTKQGPGA